MGYLGNLVRPESHPEPRGFPVQLWADPGVVSRPVVHIRDPIAPRSAPRPPLVPVLPHGSIGLFAPFKLSYIDRESVWNLRAYVTLILWF